MVVCLPRLAPHTSIDGPPVFGMSLATVTTADSAFLAASSMWAVKRRLVSSLTPRYEIPVEGSTSWMSPVMTGGLSYFLFLSVTTSVFRGASLRPRSRIHALIPPYGGVEYRLH